LRGNLSRRIIRQAVILSWGKGEFRLKEKINARQISFDQSVPDRLTDSGLVVMTPLIGGIDSQKPG
jgi:hypothetical protein